MDLMQDLQRQGWYLTENGIKDCREGNSGKLDDVIRAAMDMDLKEIGEKHLPESLGKAKTEFVDGPFILQIQKVRNVAVPKESDHLQGDGGQKLMRLSLTDGQGTCTAVDMNGISGLSNGTPPGSKIKLLGRVPVNQGFLLLNKSNCKLLGGRVEKLVENWELKRALAMQNRASNTQEGGPPPFIPFGQRRKDAQPVSNKRDNFRSLEAVAKKKELDLEFEQQRKAIIEAALQEGRAKSFTSASTKQVQAQDRNVASIVEMGFSVDQANAALRRTNGHLEDAVTSLLGDGDAKPNNVGNHHDARHPGGSQARRPPPLLSLDGPERPGGRRRGGRTDETEDYDQHTKPSAPATLFDFVTTKIPSKSDKAASKSQHTVPDGSRDKDKPRQQSPDDSSSKADDRSRQRSPEVTTNKDKPRPESPEDRGPTSPDEGPDNHQNSLSSVSQNAGHGGGVSSNHHNPVQNLPPRLQKKQLREEEEKMYKFHGKDSAIADWTRDRMSHKVYDVNSRGPVSHKSLWSDEKDSRDKNNEKGTAQKGKPGDGGKSGDGKLVDGDKNYQRSTKDGSGYQMQASQLQQQQQQQPLHLMNTVKPLMECTPCSVQSLMQCTPDGVQLMQSMGALQLYPAAPIQVAQAPAYVHGHATAPPSVVRDGVTSNVSKENISWKLGDMCMAKWRDKQYYRAKIIQTDSHFALVSFIDYGNDADKVLFADLRPLTARDTNIVYSSSMPPGTSILYPEHGASMVYPSHNGHYSAVPVCSAGGPPSGILVQGPGAFANYPSDHSYRIITNSGRASGLKSSSSKRPVEKQLYIPPAQRK